MHAPSQENQENTSEPAGSEREAAARVLQKHWRIRQARVRCSPTMKFDADARWRDAVLQARAETARNAAHNGKNDPMSRWRRAVFMAGRLEDGLSVAPSTHDTVDDSVDVAKDSLKKTLMPRKTLEAQHWLELIDRRHRYGSNLKWYHRKWQQEDTTDNFFKWLDEGDGRLLSLPQCPRERLEKECIIYLSAEQRLKYLVKIDDKGLLRWSWSNELVDTTPDKWKDAGSGRGIVPLGSEDHIDIHHLSAHSRSNTMGTEDSVCKATHYTETNYQGMNPVERWIKSTLSPTGLMERLLRRTVMKNTWIYVADMHMNMFVGIKEPGAFQHSSFTGGGLISSAGLIKVKDGRIKSLSPLSGHYRTSIEHFRYFLRQLDEHGADLSRVKVGKAEMLLWGFAEIAKAKRRKRRFVQDMKDRVHRPKDAPSDPSADRASSVKSPTSSQGDGEEEISRMRRWKRDVIHGRHRAASNPATQKDPGADEKGKSPIGRASGSTDRRVTVADVEK